MNVRKLSVSILLACLAVIPLGALERKVGNLMLEIPKDSGATEDPNPIPHLPYEFFHPMDAGTNNEPPVRMFTYDVLLPHRTNSAFASEATKLVEYLRTNATDRPFLSRDLGKMLHGEYVWQPSGDWSNWTAWSVIVVETVDPTRVYTLGQLTSKMRSSDPNNLFQKTTVFDNPNFVYTTFCFGILYNNVNPGAGDTLYYSNEYCNEKPFSKLVFVGNEDPFIIGSDVSVATNYFAAQTNMQLTTSWGLSTDGENTQAQAHKTLMWKDDSIIVSPKVTTINPSRQIYTASMDTNHTIAIRIASDPDGPWSDEIATINAGDQYVFPVGMKGFARYRIE